MTNSPLPQNIEAEHLVLGSILIKGDLINRLSGNLSSKDFDKEAHTIIFDAMVQMYQGGIPIDVVTIFDYMKSDGHLLEEVGGSSYLTYLMELVPTTANVDYYAKLVAEASKDRAFITAIVKSCDDLQKGKTDRFNAITKLISKIEPLNLSSSINEIPLKTADDLISKEGKEVSYYVEI